MATSDGHELAPCLAQLLAPDVRSVKAPPLSTLRWAAGSATPCPSTARAPPAAPGSSARQRTKKHTARRSFSAGLPQSRPASSARASGRCATRRTLAPPRRRCQGASSRGAAWRRSRRTPPRSAAAARPAQSGVLEDALAEVLEFL